MKHPLSFIACTGILFSSVLPAATVQLGAYGTNYTSAAGTAEVDQAATYYVDLSDLTGLTPGAPIRIDFTPDDSLFWLGVYLAETGGLEFLWQAEMQISVGGYSTTFTEDWAFGPVPFVHDPSVLDYAGYSFGPDPVTRSLVVPWGTDLRNLSFTLRDRSRILAEVSGVFTQSQMIGIGATFTTSSVESPEIGIEKAGGVNLETNDEVDFGVTVPGQQTSIVFTIHNAGASPLVLSGVNLASTPPGSFSIAAPVSGSVTAGGSLDFTVTFAPSSAGVHHATFTLPSNDADESSFILEFSGNALSFVTDSDGDGLNDASEFKMAALGFNWQVQQTALVYTLFANAAGAGLFTTSQVHALHSGTPLIARDPGTGKFKLTMDWKKSTNLTDFLDFPAPPGSSVSINPQGDVEFEFPSTDDAAFFRIEMD